MPPVKVQLYDRGAVPVVVLEILTGLSVQLAVALNLGTGLVAWTILGIVAVAEQPKSLVATSVMG